MAKKNKQIQRISVGLNLDILDEIIQYIATSMNGTGLIPRRSLQNVKRLFDIIDDRPFETNDMMMARIVFIRKALDGIIERNINKINILSNYVLGGKYDEEFTEGILPDIEGGQDLDEKGVQYINTYVSERLSYAYLFAYKDEIMDNLEQLEVISYNSLEEINSTLRRNLEELLTHMRQAQAQESYTTMFDLHEENFDTKVADAMEELKRPTNFLHTGIQKLNEMLRGGFEAGRYYLFLGLSNNYKSGLLLSIAKWLREYNNGRITTKDPSKRPCVLYITQENSERETIERLYSLTVGRDDLISMPTKEIIRRMKTDGGLALRNDTDINLRIAYRPNKSISTDDIYVMMDEIEEEGEEVIAVIHDYVKRIRPVNGSKELRLELSNVVDEECTIAKTKNIPFISASQLNREAMKIVESVQGTGQMDVAKKLGSSNVGEAWGMIENSDFVAIINRGFRLAQNRYFLEIKKVKDRSNGSTIPHIAHPFEEENEFKLVEDYNDKEPASIVDMLNTPGASADPNSGGVGLRRRGSAVKMSSHKVSDTSGDDLEELG